MVDSVDVRVETFDGSTASLTDGLVELYGAVYTEKPYCDGPSDVAEFVAEWPELRSRPGFRLAVARATAAGLVGFGLGHRVEPDSAWWPANRSGAATGSAALDVPTEDIGVSFGIAELGVHPTWRQRGVARLVHEALLTGCTEPQVVLWVRADAPAAVAAYHRWGYRLVGAVLDRPPYQVMCRPRPVGAARPGRLL